jgi:hypothetical protein
MIIIEICSLSGGFGFIDIHHTKRMFSTVIEQAFIDRTTNLLLFFS